MTDECILSVENVVKKFGKFKALDEASLSIRKGCIFGIIGPNGAGKSTLLRIVTSLAHPDSGRVLVNGIDVETNPKKALAGTGAIVDSPAFYPDLSARLNLDILSRGSGKKYRKRRDELAEYTGIAGWMNHRVREFSLGMKQRLAITLALLPDSHFVILDEPTNGLDPNGIVDIRNLIRNLGADFGATALKTYQHNKLCEEFKRFLPNHTLKDLRHTFTTRARECGIDNELVAVWTGHSLGNITSKVYTHFSIEFQQEQAKKLVYN